jgi:putative transcriptional regulator
MEDPHFKDTIVLITELNERGAMGFTLNKPFARNLNELVEFSSSQPFPLYIGGPVDGEHLYFIHQQPSIISSGELVTDGLFMGGNFKEAVEAIDAELLTTNDVKIFVGYCGWDAGELEIEVEEGSWEVIEIFGDTTF